MRRCTEYGYQGADKRSDARCRNPDGDPYDCGLHWREAEQEQRCVLAASAGIDVMHQIGSEGPRQCCSRYAYDREQSERLRKVVHLAAKLTIAFGYEHSRLKPEGFPQPLHHRRNILRRPSDDESIGQRRSPKYFL